ncbi:hypothetical protein [Bartonella sp. AP1QHHD]
MSDENMMFEGDGKKCTLDIDEPSFIVRTKASVHENGLEIETNEG